MTSSAAFILIAAVAALAQAPAADQFTLGEVVVVGANRSSQADVLKGSGLAIGQTVTVTAIGDAANRLSSTGLYSSVRYRYVTLGARMTVTFEVEEIAEGVPVVFDNFVWFTDDELATAVRAELPTFGGTAPETSGAIDGIRRSLAALLKARGVPGDVRYTPDADYQRQRLTRHLFSVVNPGPRLCALTFDGAAGVPPRDLLAAIPGVLGQDYSSVRLRSLAGGTLQRVYRQRGFWRADFALPVVTLDPGCQGVKAVLPVREGPSFAFDRIEWSGHAALTAERLDDLFELKRGAVADIRVMEEGLNAVGKAYRRQGYITQDAVYVPRLDDAAKRATFAVAIVEGPQFRLGSIEFAGFDDRQAAALKKEWRLQPGDVFDEDYPFQFVRAQFLPKERTEGSTQFPAIETRVDTSMLVVHVRVVRK